MTRKQLFPKVDKDVRRLMDETSTRQIKYISIIVVVFESLTLALFMMTRKNFGKEEWISFHSVLFCILSSLIVYLSTRHILKNQATNHMQVVFLNVAYYLVMSVWSMWSSYYKYRKGEQIITFYAVEIMLVCFIVVKPWVGIVLNLLAYSFVYTVLYQIDHAAGISTINYSILALVSIIGMVVRYHTLKGTSEAMIQLEKTKNSEIEERNKIRWAIANIYDRVNLIDFENCTEMPLRAKEEIRYELDLSVRTHTVMTSNIRQYIMPDQLDDFIRYTDISTVRERLLHKRLISEDFIDVKDGWFRAQYIPVEVDENGVPTKVVFTTRNVDDEKKREEWLIRIAMTDELTRLYNRRSYDEDLKQYKEQGMEEDFAILSADVNGLKNVNDTMGHVAGDELIQAAAECLLLAVGSNGKVYRTGGDEFLAILHTDDAERICQNIESAAKMWQGKYAKELSISIGYAAVKDHKGLDIHEIEKLADQKMYQAKAEYYQNKTK